MVSIFESLHHYSLGKFSDGDSHVPTWPHVRMKTVGNCFKSFSLPHFILGIEKDNIGNGYNIGDNGNIGNGDNGSETYRYRSDNNNSDRKTPTHRL
uniref:Uncharacterized protein n=1 Tax=Arundo donax TaxID=35708 RepID=A0A0A9GPM7_ARUDO